jgi:hypothetical protein
LRKFSQSLWVSNEIDAPEPAPNRHFGAPHSHARAHSVTDALSQDEPPLPHAATEIAPATESARPTNDHVTLFILEPYPSCAPRATVDVALAVLRRCFPL